VRSNAGRAFERTNELCVRPHIVRSNVKNRNGAAGSDGFLGHRVNCGMTRTTFDRGTCVRPSVRSNAPSAVERTWQESKSSLSVFLLSCGQLLL
jgi:hypothetical protein